jgi:hypothetical protein
MNLITEIAQTHGGVLALADARELLRECSGPLA